MDTSTDATLAALASTKAGEDTEEQNTTELALEPNSENLSEPAFTDNPEPAKQTKPTPVLHRQSILDSFLPLANHPSPANKVSPPT